jgi:hypothetical protein
MIGQRPVTKPNPVSRITMLVGRSDGGIHICFDPSASGTEASRTEPRKNAEYRWIDGGLFVIGLCSLCGTSVDNIYLPPDNPNTTSTSVKIKDGSILRLGKGETRTVRK